VAWKSRTAPRTPYALLRAAQAITQVKGTQFYGKKWINAARLYLEEYIVPIVGRTPYGVVPFGLFRGQPTADTYRTLGSGLTYRFFMPAQNGVFWVGLNAHLLSHALFFAEAGKFFSQSSYRDLSYRQLEWIFGSNPFGASLATGIGRKSPSLFSRFLGPINGGIMNGIGGDNEDQPILDMPNSENWRNNEYWSPHVGYCQWALSALL